MNGTLASVGWPTLLVVLIIAGAGGSVSGGEPPLADAGLDQQVQQNATVLLDAAGSRDPDGTIQSYRWTIETPGGLTVRPADSSAPRTSFVARHPGRYEVTVTVRDDDGHTAADTLYVDVTPRGPTRPAADSGTSGPSPPEVPPADGPSGASSRTRSPGESSSAPTTVSTGRYTTGGGSTTDTRPSCADDQRYLPVFDSCSGVRDRPPVIRIEGPTLVSPGSQHSFVAEAGDFPDGIDRIEWAGGETGSMVLRSFPEKADTRTLRATVYDGEGNTRTTYHTVYVGSEDPPPRVDVRVSESGCVGEQVTFEGTASARASDRIERTWWPGPDPTFTPGEPGIYSRTFKASDDDGQTATETAHVQVEECDNSNILSGSSPGPKHTDRIVIVGTDTTLQATVDTKNLTRGSYEEDAKRMGGGFGGTIADAVEGIGHLGRDGGETVVGQTETVLKRTQANGSAAKRAVLLAQGEYGRTSVDPDESPEQLLFADDRALVNPTVVDGMDRGADNYVIVVKQDSRRNIVDRLQSGEQGIESAEPFESSGKGVPNPTSAGDGMRPTSVLEPIEAARDTAADRVGDNYNEALTFRDRLLDDGNSLGDMAEITGERVLGEQTTESVGDLLSPNPDMPGRTDDQPSSPVDRGSDSFPDSGRGSGHEGQVSPGDGDESGSVIPDGVTDAANALNPLSGTDREATTPDDGSPSGGSDPESGPDAERADEPRDDGPSDGESGVSGVVPDPITETAETLNPLSDTDRDGEESNGAPSDRDSRSSGRPNDGGSNSDSDLFGSRLPDSVDSATSSADGDGPSGADDSGELTINVHENENYGS